MYFSPPRPIASRSCRATITSLDTQHDADAQTRYDSTIAPSSSTLPAFASPFGNAPLEERARTYLHANCSNCHRGDKRPSLEFDKTLAQTQLCEAPAMLVPGNPSASPLVKLMRSTDPSVRMPKSAGSIIDEAGVKLIEQWVAAQKSCP